MEILNKMPDPEFIVTRRNSYTLTCFPEAPCKTDFDQPTVRIGAFELFNLFTADIIKTKEVFTR